MNWKPIATAPIDGTEILTFTRFPTGDYYRVLQWTDDGTDIESGQRIDGWTPPDDGYVGMFEPSHWMSLPAPPKEEE